MIRLRKISITLVLMLVIYKVFFEKLIFNRNLSLKPLPNNIFEKNDEIDIDKLRRPSR
ncbi:hypothetical protein HCCG_00170 [Helicobacter cinaedi CCUG 18818 = ATCC BAA-847]|uniref:Uncharacterized protein n=1 Tax=Helicobacter cinaedi CCUG 18818 = ATCC BAA-847 TaxID=537971 RepID=A0ABN0B818_9HELI|nr:hypothetical protein HCCG_00170 [Helicobacter cinaedi CCUG 18818 = ATCC BAA-847]